MKLAGVKKQDGWLFSEWRLTYRVGWGHILKAAKLLYHYTDSPEILVSDAAGSNNPEIGDEDGIMQIRESGSLTLRGTSQILKVPLMITFFNQMDLVRVTVACASEEFMEADYMNFNLSMCQFLDSAEIAMYR